MEAARLITYQNFETIRNLSLSVFNKMEYQIKSYNETCDPTQSSTNEKITKCFIKEFQEVLIVV